MVPVENRLGEMGYIYDGLMASWLGDNIRRREDFPFSREVSFVCLGGEEEPRMDEVA